MFDSILNFGQYRYLKYSMSLVVITVILYFSKSPGEPPNGGTWQGYTLGTISAALILFLLWFGIRKRQYHHTESSLAGWASAHVYLGISLPIVVSLHCGFQFDWNVHTLAYALMILVVLSGFYGLYSYLVFPSAVTSNREGINRREMISTIAKLDDTGLKLAEGLGAETHHQVLRKVVDTRLGGTLWQQIKTGINLPTSPNFKWKFVGIYTASKEADLGEDRVSPEKFLRNYMQISQSTEEINQAVELLKLLNERESMVSRVQRDIRYHTLMKCWLFLHIPLSCALLAAVLTHVISVFFYW
jgi:hypothetical protein